ncbi:hypothetical protein, partial [Klebsiella pneumoniae]|uniref:hypothetical protein n=1 Tax=Klebsiella pneumoniae TaxID=573 RepID=UPI00196319F4
LALSVGMLPVSSKPMEAALDLGNDAGSVNQGHRPRDDMCLPIPQGIRNALHGGNDLGADDGLLRLQGG